MTTKTPLSLNAVDRVVAFFSPRAGLLRLGARGALNSLVQSHKAHESATPGRSRKFHREVAGPNGIVSQGASALRAQARHMERNNDIARGILRTMVNNIVGPTGIGIEPQPRRMDGSIHEEYAQALREAWRDWCITPEVTHVFHFSAVQRMMVKAWLRDGEAFSQSLIGAVPYLDHGTTVPFSLEIFEADMVPLHYQNNANIHQGIERNAWGRPTAYYVYRGNPLEASNGNIIAGLDAASLKRISAERIIHLALRDRIGQMRGISEFASIIGRLEDIREYEDSERIAAKVAASLTAYVKKTNPEGYDPAMAEDDENGKPVGRSLAMSAGTIIDGLAVGEEIGLIDSKRPNPNVVTFRMGQLRAVAAGVGASYSSIARDYNGTYSAQRQELVEQWVNYATLTDEFVGQYLQPVWQTFVQAAHLSGTVKAPAGVRPGSADDALYVAQSMPWIDPMREAEAYTILVQAGFASEVEVMRKRGVNPRDLLEQITQWRKETASKGLIFSSDAANEQQHVAAATAEKSAEKTSEEDKTQQSAQTAAALHATSNHEILATMAAGVAAMAAREPSPINIAPSPITIHQAPVNVTTPEVHVAPAAVAVAVQPAPVVVNHPASATAEHERDPETQEILRTVTTYHQP